MSTTQASRGNAAVATQTPSSTPQDKRPATAKTDPEWALGAAVKKREALGVGGMLALQAAAGNRAVVGLVQAKRGKSSADARVLEAAEVGIGGTSQAERAPNATGLPEALKLGVESLSGYSLDDVRVHYNSSKPTELGALAYAQGSEIHVGPGQEAHLPHEAWHVVQQKQGRAPATRQLKHGVTVNDDAGLEHEAEVMGTKALVARPASATGLVHARASGFQYPVQRVVAIDNQHYVKDKKDAKKGYLLFSTSEHFQGADDTERAIIDALLQSPTQFSYSSAAWRTEIKMRKALIEGMDMINGPQYAYNWESDDLHLPATWQSVDYTSEGSQKEKPHAAFTPNGGSASAAIDNLFAPAGPGETFYLDCSSAIVAVQYRALLEAHRDAAVEEFGAPDDDEFDRRFDAPGSLVIHPEGVTGTKPNGTVVPSPVSDLAEEVTVDSLDKLVPGDLVYFVSYADYDETHEGPAAAWAGEHATYCGDDKFRGFGVEPKSMAEMVAQLQTAYNNQARKSNAPPKKELEAAQDTITGKRPGLSKQVKRLKALK